MHSDQFKPKSHLKLSKCIFSEGEQFPLRLRHDLRSTDGLDLMRSPYTYSDAYQREDLDVAVSFALAWLLQMLLAKKLPYSQMSLVRLFYLWPCDVIFLPDLKMTSAKIVNLVRP